MSRRNARSNNVGLELKLNLSPPQQQRGRGATRGAGRQAVAAAAAAAESPDTSPARSCVSSEDSLKYSSSPETTSMVVVGCPRCLMYVMLSEVDPMCPKCKSTVLLDLNPTTTTTSHRRRRHYEDNDGEASAN